MSCAPRPQSTPSTTSPDHGSRCHSAGSASTVSTCESRHSVGPSPVPRRRATRLGRSSVRPSRSTSKPASRSRPASSSCAGRSLPGGLTVLACTRRWSSSVVSRSRSSAIAPGYDTASPGGVGGQVPDGAEDADQHEEHVVHRRAREDMGHELALRRRRGRAQAFRRGCLGTPAGRAHAPATLDEVVGQEHLLAEGSALRTAIEQGRPHSMVLYGPPGLGQDDARADRRRGGPRGLRGAQRGRGRPRRGAQGDRARRSTAGGSAEPTVLFLDEIHRFNKAQQDALLPAVEEGLVTLIGATTENPVLRGQRGAALALRRSTSCTRCWPSDVEVVLRRAVEAGSTREADDDAIEFLAARSGGDARTALDALELAVATTHGRRARVDAARARTRCSAARCATTRPATATTTRSRPGSRPRAARTPTPRSTTSR